MINESNNINKMKQNFTKIHNFIVGNNYKILFLIFFSIINFDIFPLIGIEKENEIIIGEIVFRKKYNTNINDIQLGNRYFVIFEVPWKTEIFGNVIEFDEILIVNDNTEFIDGIDYMNKKFKIYCKLGFYQIDKLKGKLAIYIKIIELIN
jgi:hypothetical protein